MLYKCRNSSESWIGEIQSVSENKVIELQVNSRGSYFHILVGKHNWGNFLCVPNWNIGIELAELNNRHWNLERILQQSPDIHLVDAISIVDALVALSKTTKL